MTLDEVVGAYCAAWNETDPAARMKLLEQSWGVAAVYVDPTGAAPAGRAGLHGHIAGFHQAYPGAKIVPTSKVDAHHGKIHFTWRLIMPDGSVAIDGRDFGEVDSIGHITRIVGFFGPPPEL